MSSRRQASDRRRRKTVTFIWMAALSVAVIALIYWEQTALLYILATLGVTALLVIVAMADLHGEAPADAELRANESVPAKSKARSTFGATP